MQVNFQPGITDYPIGALNCHIFADGSGFRIGSDDTGFSFQQKIEPTQRPSMEQLQGHLDVATKIASDYSDSPLSWNGFVFSA